MKFALWICLVLMIGCSKAHVVTPVVQTQRDSELAAVKWNLFVPQESEGAGCRLTFDKIGSHSGKEAMRLTSLRMARFGIYADQPTPIQVKVGQRYRLTAWVRAGNNFAIEAGTPGLVLRATLFDRQRKDVPGGHIFVGLGGMRRGDATLLSTETVPTDWTKIEGVIEIPTGTTQMILFVFCWKSSGTIWVDDISVTEVGAS